MNRAKPPPSCPLPGAAAGDGRITLAHGSGGRLSAELIERLVRRHFSNPALDRLEDAATLPATSGRLAFSTDTFVVQPRFFPGGNIGELAVNGTVNDLAMMGARPRWLSVGFVLEEGFSLAELEEICASMRQAADNAGVTIVTGDTKVVGRGGCDGLFINTAGIGVVPEGVDLGAHRLQAGDRLIVSGPIGSHGMAVMLARGQLSFASEIASDTAPLAGLAADILRAAGSGLHAMRDATRGGLGAVLAEFGRAASLGMEITEQRLPVQPDVQAACDILGLDPLFVANEGVLVAVVTPETVDAVLAACHAHPQGKHAACIGAVCAEHPGKLLRRTPFGGRQIVPIPAGELLPRIC